VALGIFLLHLNLSLFTVTFGEKVPSLAKIRGMAIPVVEFPSGGTKLERFLHKNQHTHRKLLNFEFWMTSCLK
jgi:hypothetical protein